MKILPIKEQIELLEKIKSLIENRNDFPYLCNLYFYAKCGFGVDYEHWESRCRDFGQQVPLFRFKYAQQFGAKSPHLDESGWWPSDEIEKRIAYLDWMIEQLKKEDNNTFMMGL